MNASSDHPAALSTEELLQQCEIRFQRRSGPGGQHRNKVETAVLLSHRPTDLTAEANERRSQAENRKVALFRLRVNLALGVRQSRPADSLPSRLWRSRCAGKQVQIRESHEDFPAMLAEALDVIATHDWDVKAAATTLDTTTSQLLKLLKKEPRAFAEVNRQRHDRGLHALR